MVQNFQYNNLPAYIFNGTILEIGAGTGQSQLCSKYREQFLSDQYIGIDLVKNDIKNIYQEDLMSCDRTADTVLCIHVLEHFPLNEWIKIVKKLYSMVLPGGYLVIQVPHDEHMEKYVVNRRIMELYLETYPLEIQNKYHVVFGITLNTMQYLLPDAKIITHRTPIYWRDCLNNDERYLRVLGRFIKRLITFNPKVWNGLRMKKWAITCILKKNKEK